MSATELLEKRLCSFHTRPTLFPRSICLQCMFYCYTTYNRIDWVWIRFRTLFEIDIIENLCYANVWIKAQFNNIYMIHLKISLKIDYLCFLFIKIRQLHIDSCCRQYNSKPRSLGHGIYTFILSLLIASSFFVDILDISICL